MSRCALGVDVSLSRGLDALALDEAGNLVLGPLKTEARDLGALAARVQPDVVAIDSPPEWPSHGRSRPLERQLRALGINIYATPADPDDHKFYRWVRVGFEAFRAVSDVGYALYRGGRPTPRQAIEVYPHASAVVLRGSLPPSGEGKVEWRGRVLREAGISIDGLRTIDQIDGGLAALTGLHFLQGRFCYVGEENRAVLVLPADELPSQRYARDRSPARTVKATSDHSAHTRGRPQHPCRCGCGKLVNLRYAPGHDARHRSQLIKRMRAGDTDAVQELNALGWSP